jgi:hypothetical protein
MKDSNCRDPSRGPLLADRAKQRVALGTAGEPIGSILDIRTGDDRAIVK